jgi:hypothetical protein
MDPLDGKDITISYVIALLTKKSSIYELSASSYPRRSSVIVCDGDVAYPPLIPKSESYIPNFEHIHISNPSFLSQRMYTPTRILSQPIQLNHLN